MEHHHLRMQLKEQNDLTKLYFSNRDAEEHCKDPGSIPVLVYLQVQSIIEVLKLWINLNVCEFFLMKLIRKSQGFILRGLSKVGISDQAWFSYQKYWLVS